MGKPSKIVISSRKIINWDDLCDFCWVVKGSSAKYIQIWETWFNRLTNKKPYKDGDGIPMCIQGLKRCWFKLLDLHENIWREASEVCTKGPKNQRFAIFLASTFQKSKVRRVEFSRQTLCGGEFRQHGGESFWPVAPGGQCENSPPSFPLRMGHPLADLKERNISS